MASKKNIGTGSASVVLIFTVLCLTVFTLISYTAAGNDMDLATAEAKLVKGYYEADTLAERILTELLAAKTVPKAVYGVAIATEWDEALASQTAEFSCAISQRKELYVKIAFRENAYDILAWRMRDVGDWPLDTSLPVWPGE